MSPLAELRELLRRRWLELPAAARTDQQVSGTGAIACGATHGVMERCNFACTACYLTDLANDTPPAELAEVTRQLDALRAALGPAAKVQITAGEVTLLPVEQLGAIVAYARRIGLEPMVMSNGERVRRDPRYLEALVRDYGLRKIGIHVDTTQRGRRGYPFARHERELHPVRDEFAELLGRVRKVTGRRLDAAQTMTVTAANLAHVGDVVRWAIRNAGSFRLLSLLPVADVGRTEERPDGELTIDRVWREVCRGAGRRLNRDAMHFGHRECNATVPVVVARFGDRFELIEAVRAGHRWDRRAFRLIARVFGPRADASAGVAVNLRRCGPALLRHPLVATELAGYFGYRAAGLLRLLPRLLGSLARRRPVAFRPLLFVVHRFMSRGDLATPLGRERLDACVFKLAVGDRIVSMCEMNATDLRERVNRAQIDQPSRNRSSNGVTRSIAARTEVIDAPSGI